MEPKSGDKVAIADINSPMDGEIATVRRVLPGLAEAVVHVWSTRETAVILLKYLSPID